MSETPRYILCPYCGHPQPTADRCGLCGGHFEPLSRKATQISMGPWYIRDRNVPFRPGCSFEILKKQIDAGKVKPNTVLRGPTTHQFWSVARNTPGVSHLLGYCHECNSQVKPTDSACHSCKTKFVTPAQRNELGLLYPTPATAAAAQKVLDRQINKVTGKGDSTGSSQEETRAPVQGGADLLDQVLGAVEKKASRSGSSSSQAKTATPAQAPKPAKPPAKPGALDFTPAAASASEAARDEAGILWSQQHALSQEDVNPTGEVPAKTAGASNTWLIWVLVASNLLVVGLLAAVVWFMRQPAG